MLLYPMGTLLYPHPLGDWMVSFLLSHKHLCVTSVWLDYCPPTSISVHPGSNSLLFENSGDTLHNDIFKRFPLNLDFFDDIVGCIL